MTKSRWFFATFLLVSLVLTLLFSQWRFDFVPSVKANPTYEDFLNDYTYTYTENCITRTTTRCTGTSVDRDDRCFVYADKGVGHFTGDFEHIIDVTTHYGVLNGVCGVWALWNAVDDWTGCSSGTGIILFLLAGDSPVKYRIYLREYTSGVSESDYTDAYYAFDTVKYLTISRSGTTITCVIYPTASDRTDETNADDTLSVGQTSTDYQYIYGLQSLDAATGTQYITCYCENLDLQEAPPPSSGVTLTTPSDAATETSWSVNFVFNATFYQTIQNASLHLANTTTVPTAISWSTNHWNTSAVDNKTDETIAYSFSGNGEGSYKWNVEVFNSTHGVFATSNRTLTIDVAPRYQNVDSNSTWVEPNGTILLYGQGYDGIGSDFAVLATNETGSWQNYTDSPVEGYYLYYNGKNGAKAIGLAINASITVGYGDWSRQTSDNPLLEKGSPGDWDDVNVGGADVLKVNETYYMFYSGYGGAFNEIGLATSSDGVTFTKTTDGIGGTSKVLAIGAGWDATYVWCPSVVYCSGKSPKWYMFYTGRDGNTEEIGVATSTNGTTWTKYGSNPILEHNSSSWNEYHLCHCDVVWDPDNSKWVMLVSGMQSSSSGQETIGRYYCTDGNFPYTWTEDPSNPVIDYGEQSGVDDYHSFHPRIYPSEIDGTWYVFYTAATTYSAGLSCCRATTGNLTYGSFTKYANNPVLNSTGGESWENDEVFNPVLSYKIEKTYNSPVDMNDAADSWSWSNFTWCNASITAGTTIQWRIYYNDTYGNENATSIQSFIVGAYEITVVTTSHSWSITPGQTDILITEETINITVSAPLNYDIQVKGSGPLTNGSNTIALSNVKCNYTGAAISLTIEYQNVPGLTDQTAGTDIDLTFQLWLTCPSPQPVGDYTYTLTVKIREHS